MDKKMKPSADLKSGGRAPAARERRRRGTAAVEGPCNVTDAHTASDRSSEAAAVRESNVPTITGRSERPEAEMNVWTDDGGGPRQAAQRKRRAWAEPETEGGDAATPGAASDDYDIGAGHEPCTEAAAAEEQSRRSSATSIRARPAVVQYKRTNPEDYFDCGARSDPHHVCNRVCAMLLVAELRKLMERLPEPKSSSEDANIPARK